MFGVVLLAQCNVLVELFCTFPRSISFSCPVSSLIPYSSHRIPHTLPNSALVYGAGPSAATAGNGVHGTRRSLKWRVRNLKNLGKLLLLNSEHRVSIPKNNTLEVPEH